MNIAIYPGSFDPITNGHLDVAFRAAKLFDRLVIAVYRESQKPGSLFETAERISIAEDAITRSGNSLAGKIEVASFSGLTVDFARTMNAGTIVRGLRAVSDFEYEFKYAHMNNRLAPEIEVVCLMTSSRYSFISSSLIREVALLGGDVDGLVPENVRAALYQRVRERGTGKRASGVGDNRHG